MLFLGLGTGLGSAMIVEGILEPMELAHLPCRKGRSYEDYLGIGGLKRLGKMKWRLYVDDVVGKLFQFPIRAASWGWFRQNSVRSTSGFSPVHTPIKSIPSSGWLDAGLVPVVPRIVAVQSIVIAAWSVVLPAGTVPGHRTIAGTRMPPSQRFPF